MTDSKGHVFQRRDNTGGAAVYPEREPITDKWLEYTERQNTIPKKDLQDANSLLRKAQTDVGKAWSVDYEELQGDLSGVVEKLKDFEKTTNKDQRREKWYAVNEEFGKLENKIRQSQKTQQQFVNSANQVKNDQKGAYGEDSWEILDQYPKMKILDRPDTPRLEKATSQSAVKMIADNTEYVPKVKSTKTIQPDGTYKSETTAILDEGEMKQAIRASIATLPANQRNILISDTKDMFIRANPQVLSESPELQAKKFEDYVVQTTYDALEKGIRQKTSKVISQKKTDGSNVNFNFGGGVASSGKAIYTVQKADDKGTYKISIADIGKGAPAENKVMEWVLSGKEYKEITGDTAANIDDDAEMVIKGKLKYVQVNEKSQQIPVIAVSFEEMASGGPGTFQGGQFVKADKFKRGQVVHLKYIDENKAQILEYGADPLEIYKQKKQQADDEYKSRTPRSSQQAEQTGSKSPTKGTPGLRPEKAKYSSELLNFFSK